MRFVTVVGLPEAAHDKTTQPPTQLIAEAIEREEGELLSLDGISGGSVLCRYECQSVDAQIRIELVLTRAGFEIKTWTAVDPAQFDSAWSNAVKHPVAAGR